MTSNEELGHFCVRSRRSTIGLGLRLSYANSVLVEALTLYENSIELLLKLLVMWVLDLVSKIVRGGLSVKGLELVETSWGAMLASTCKKLAQCLT